MAVELFESKVDAVLTIGKWLWTTAEALQLLDDAYARWAQQLLGGDPWRNKAVAMGELGWTLPGPARTVLAVALRRARTFQRPEDDFYRKVTGMLADTPSSWGRASAAVLSEWGVSDWPVRPASCYDYGRYKDHVAGCLSTRCLPRWRAIASHHRHEVSYLHFQKCPSTVLAGVRSVELPWAVQIGIRGWCRARAGYIQVRHREGRHSAARFQHCIFCDTCCWRDSTHVFGLCSHWSDHRAKFVALLTSAQKEAWATPTDAWAITAAIFGCPASSQAFQAAVLFADAVDNAAARYWSSRRAD